MRILFFSHPNRLNHIIKLHGLLIEALPTSSIDRAEASALMIVDFLASFA